MRRIRILVVLLVAMIAVLAFAGPAQALTVAERLVALESAVAALQTDNTALAGRVTTLETENTALKAKVTTLETSTVMKLNP